MPRLRLALVLLVLVLPARAFAHAPHLSVAWLTVSGHAARAEATIGLEDLAAGLGPSPPRLYRVALFHDSDPPMS